MKYEQPYGVSDPNASYINGNPSTGTMGSIPPAASIENPQREIVNFETDSGLTPTDADLHQLSKSVQSGIVNFAIDGGNPNFIAITPTPAIAAYKLGQRFTIKAATQNTGPVQLNVNNVGWAPVVHGDKSALGAWEINPNQLITVGWDGSNWQMLTGGGGGLITMNAPRTFYIDANIGSDTAYDGTQAAINGTHGPFLTLAHAFSVVTTFNQLGYQVTIQCADGSYFTSAIVSAPIPNGSGAILIRGNPGNPYNVKFVNVTAGTMLLLQGGNYVFDGVYFQATAAAAGDAANCLWFGTSCSVRLNAVAFGLCPGYHILAQGGGCAIVGPIHIYGGGSAHIAVYNGGAVSTVPNPVPDIHIHNNVTFSSAFAFATTNGSCAPIYNTIDYMSGAVVTGSKYNATGNGVVNSGGRGASYLPGSLAGNTSTGGQYL